MTYGNGRFLTLVLACGLVAPASSTSDEPKLAVEQGKSAAVDFYGDPLPAGARLRLGTQRFRNGAGIFAVAWSPDGKIIATGGGSPWIPQGVQSADFAIRLWDAAAGNELRTLKGHPNAVSFITFAPDGKTLAAGCPQDSSVRFWKIDGSDEPQQIQLNGNPSVSMGFAYSHDGKFMALAGGPEPVIQIREVASGKTLREFGKQPLPFDSLAFAPDGKTLAAKSANQIRLFDVSSGRLVRKFRPKTYYAKQRRLGIESISPFWAPGGATAPVLFAPDGKLLVAEGGDHALHVWESETGKELMQLVHRAPIVSAVFAPDGKTLATGCQDNTIRVWDIPGGKERLHVEGHFGGYMGVAYSSDGKFIASAGGDHAVRIWDASSGEEIRKHAGHQGEVFAGAFLNDGKVLVTVGRDNCVRFWDTLTGKETRQFQNRRDIVDAVAFAPDGKILATGSEEDEMIHIWETASGKHLREFSGRSNTMAFTAPDTMMTLSADGLIAGRSTNGTDDWTAVVGSPQPLTTFAYSPDGKVAALGMADNTLRLWSLTPGKDLKPLEGLMENEHTVGFVFALDGKTLASLHMNNAVHLWEVATGKHLHRLQHAGESAFSNMSGHAAFSPDGRTIATTGSGDNGVRLWEVATGKERRRFSGHRGPVAFVAYAPDGKSVASGGWDTTVLIWDLAGWSKEELQKPATLTAKQFESLWIDLAEADAAKAYQALRRLARSPHQSLTYLRDRMQPVSAVDNKKIALLIGDLDSDQFGKRQRASDELERLGPLAEVELRKALTSEVSLEVRRRIEQLLEKLKGSSASTERLRTSRALELLEMIGDADAKKLLTNLAQGSPLAALSQDAKATLERLGKVPQKP